jgi:glycosyltransferase involved in cell wall biosynthesis
MKIVHISQAYHPSQGGVQFFFKNISERLVRDYGDDVTVVTTDSMYGPERKIYKKAGPKYETINGVKIIRFSFKRWHIKPSFFLFRVIKKLSLKVPEKMVLRALGPYSPEMKKYLMNVDADAFCASSINYYYMQLPLWRKCNFFYYGSIHLDEDEKKHALYPTQLKAIKASTLYLANTTYEKERLQKIGVNPEKIFVLGTGVNIDDFITNPADVFMYKKSIGIPEKAIVIGYIGRIERPKNVVLLIKSFLEIAKKYDNVYLLIGGSANTHLDELKEYCSAYPPNILDRIKWISNFSFEEKSLIFNTLDILVLTSHNESFGLVFLEAWSCKKPVIGTSIGAIRNVISNEVDGLLIDINNVESLSKQLLRLINDKTLRDTMGENGYNKVKENYTWDIIVSRLRKCYLDANALNGAINN